MNELKKIVQLERILQPPILDLFRFTPRKTRSPPAAAATTTSDDPLAESLRTVLYPLEINGFYKVTGPQEATFFVTTDVPKIPVGEGWSGTGFMGVQGQIRLTGATLSGGAEAITSLSSESYSWKFTFQSDTDQFIQGVQYVTASTLFPPGQFDYIIKKTKTPIYGYYIVSDNVPKFYFTVPPPAGMTGGWVMEGLPTINGQLKILNYNENLFVGQVQDPVTNIISDVFVNMAELRPLDNNFIPENNLTKVYVQGFPALVQEADFSTNFSPGTFTLDTVAPGIKVEINPRIEGGKHVTKLRDLDTGFPMTPPVENKYEEVRNRGFSAGSILALFATGPQEEFLITKKLQDSQWDASFKQHTNFVMYQRLIPIPPPLPSYQGQTVQIELLPTELGHLLSNMYLKCTMPALPAGYSYTEQIGRALIKQVDFLINETVVETLYDDWYIIRDQVFLDADEQLGMFSAVGGATVNSQTQFDVIIPLEFFFCRRHSQGNKGRERLRKPYFPLCAIWNQKIYVRFTFHPNTWWCDVPTPHTTDLIKPSLITEEILLENSEKLYYQNTPLKYIVNRVKKESTLAFTSTQPQLQLTASFPVQTIAWFFRKRDYEKVDTGSQSSERYSYGYTTQYISTGIQLTFPSGVTRYVDVIENAKITLNNVDILSTFQGSLYYSFKQPIEHGLSIPSKNIYTYSFGLTPKEYNQGGYLNFSKLNSQTTTLSLSFNPTYAQQVIQGYNLYVFYYGYTILEFQNGFARLPFL
jgi:hypothetical protein